MPILILCRKANADLCIADGSAIKEENDGEVAAEANVKDEPDE